MRRVRIYPGESVDDLLHGELKLIQKRKGYRYSVDALLLARFALPADGLDVIDLGCGSGVIALILAARSSPKKVLGVEIQAGLAGMARRNVRMNGLEKRVRILHRDILNLPEALPRSFFDLVVSNPPFIPKGAGRLSDLREKSVARHEVKIDLDGIVGVSKHLVRPSGGICMIYPVARLEEVKAKIAEKGLHVSRIQFAYDREGGSPKLFCIEARKKPAGPARNLDPVHIETPFGKFAL